MSDQAWGHSGPDLLILGPNELERYQRILAKVCRKDRRMIDHECPECGEPLLSVVQGEELTAEITGPLTGAPADGWVCPECGVFFAEGTVEGEEEP